MTTELIPLEDLRPHPANRKRFDPAQLEELAKSLQTSGQITPTIVRPIVDPKDGRELGYELLAGERRWRAAKIAGLPTLVAIVRELDDQQALEIVAIENGQREDLDPIDEAELYKAMLTLDGYSVPKIAERLKRSETYVKDRLRLLRLIEPARKLVIEGTIPAQHAILLAGLQPADQKRAITGRRMNGSAYHVEGLFRGERTLFDDERDTRVPVSVAEFRDWIRREVRLDPRAPVAGELFPETVAAVQEADASKMKVLALTTDYRVSDAAKDPKVRTIGHEHWKRADGKKGSKVCKFSELGVVVAGEAQGEGYAVCIRKDKCAVHWGPEMRAAAKRAKERAAVPASGESAKAPKKEESWEERRKREDAERALLAAQRAAVLEATRQRGTPGLERLLPFTLASLIEQDAQTGLALIAEHLAIKLPHYGFAKIVAAAQKLTAVQQAEALFYLLVAGDMEPYRMADEGDVLFPLAKASGVDPKAIVAATAAEQQAAAKAAAAAAKAKEKTVPASQPKPAKKRAGDVRRAKAATKEGRGVPRAKRKITPAFMALMHPTPALAAVIGDAPVTRVDATKLLWGYLKTHGRQDKKSPRLINADQKLKVLFGGKDQVSMFELSQLMSKNLNSTAPAMPKSDGLGDGESWTDTGWMDPEAPKVEPAGLAATAKRLAGDVRREKAAKKASPQ